MTLAFAASVLAAGDVEAQAPPPDPGARVEEPPASPSPPAPVPMAPPPAPAAESTEPAESARRIVQAYNVGVPLYVHNFTKATDTSIADRLSISEFVGANYFVTEHVRVGMMVQFTEQFTGAAPSGGDRWSTFALLPQVGWNFYKRLFAAAIFTYAPRSGGKAELDLGMQALLGGSIPITEYASFGLALEVPINLRVATTIGFTPLIGLSYRL